MTTRLESTKENLAIAYASLMGQYFHLVRMVLGETVKQGNKWMISSSAEQMDWKEYANKTTWSDFQIILPVLFSLYHGIELSMKALLAINDHKISGHKLTEIYSEVRKVDDVSKQIFSLLSKYIELGAKSGILAEFTNTNNCSIDEYYDFLKYPTDKSFETINNYWPVKYKQEKALDTYNEIIADLRDLSREVHLYIKTKLPNN